MIIFNALQTTLSGGIGRYSYELAKALYKNYSKGDIKLVIREEDEYLFDFADKEELIIAKNIKNSIDRNIYEQFKLPKYINKHYPDAIIHYPDSMAPILAKNRVIITIHDLAFKSLKDVFTFKTKIWKSVITKLSVEKADKIIAITKFTEKEINKHYGKTASNKVCTILNGFNDFSEETIDSNNISNKIKEVVNEKYILTVSTISPRKNVDRLIKAFDTIKNEDLKLVIAGSYGWMYEEVIKIANEAKKKKNIIFTNKINDDELKILYKNCEMFIYPSIYEGFGLPPLEAMSFGKAVAVSNRSSLPEVVGDSAELFNPESIDEIKKSIDTLMDKENRDEYGKKSLQRVKNFSWNKCAKEMIEVYEKCLKEI